ncbi:AAA family ATPase [Roseomonas eburnea]|uniref:AAA family ATPase n=1 Tax=Neoroseomonas eburnea TaxID=1346889 RepID=A0A9X9XKM0_9PROT|nr:AAA family ATPase [Neoroseomonas eburnea]MBR0684256.1 AAA family ATPase [Neoroseomonas eburnea]
MSETPYLPSEVPQPEPDIATANVDWALAYHRLGWTPLPAHYPVPDHHGTVSCSCGSPTCGKSAGKHPIRAWRAHQAHRPNEVDLQREFSGNEKYNVALVQGAISNTIVLDFDGPRGLGTLERLEREFGPLPAGPSVETPGGGVHLFFAHPGIHVPTRKDLDDGFDVRGDGGINIAPPSVHLSGGLYRWGDGLSPGDIDAPPLPHRWVDFIVAPKVPQAAKSTQRSSSSIPSGDGATLIQDGREEYMRNTIWAVLNDLQNQTGRVPSESELFEAAWPQYERHVDLSRPGRGVDEFLRKCSYAVGRARGGTDGSAPETRPATNKQDARANARLPVLTTQEAVSLPPPEWLIEGLIVRDTLSVVYGPPRSLKSFLALHIGLSIAHGVPWGATTPAPVGVAYVAAEGAAGLGRRIQAWEQYHHVAGASNRFRLIPATINLRHPETVSLLIEALRAEESKGSFPIGLIVFDTLARSMVGGDENSALEMGQVIDAADRLRREFKSSVMLIHHTGKDRARGMRGSNRLLGDVDTSLEVERSESTGNLTVHVRKQKDAEDGQSYGFLTQSVELPLRPGRGQEHGLVVVPNPVLPQCLQAEQYDAIRIDIAKAMHPGECLTVSGLITRLRLGRGATSYSRITDALPEGLAVVAGTARDSRILRREPDPKGTSKWGVVTCTRPGEGA